VITPTAAVVMKVGFHADEEWETVIERKRAEIAFTGRSFWGYGGSACHPTRQVQPFARREGSEISVAMLWTKSRPLSPSLTAREMSVDGDQWEPLPPGIKTTGSKWALILDQLDACEETINIGEYEVGVGPRAGNPLSGYLRGQSDKGCVRRTATPMESDLRRVVAVGRLCSPWAVFLR
jgi:hypothetical protein